MLESIMIKVMLMYFNLLIVYVFIKTKNTIYILNIFAQNHQYSLLAQGKESKGFKGYISIDFCTRKRLSISMCIQYYSHPVRLLKSYTTLFLVALQHFIIQKMCVTCLPFYIFFSLCSGTKKEFGLSHLVSVNFIKFKSTKCFTAYFSQKSSNGILKLKIIMHFFL